MATKKELYTEHTLTILTALAQIAPAADEALSIWFARGYNSGGTDALQDSDVSALGLTAAQVTSGIVVIEQFAKFVGNQAVTQADYGSTLDSLRTDI